MRGRRCGQIAIVSPTSSHPGLPSAFAFSAAKAALINLAETLHSELEGQGIRLHIVNPGPLGPPGDTLGRIAAWLHLPHDQAAARLIRGLKRSRGFEIVFPRRTAWPSKALNLLPYPLFLRVLARIRDHSRLAAARTARRIPRLPATANDPAGTPAELSPPSAIIPPVRP
jgi:NAD(P)-dependent dehydrogenase (short-subunit alcohol dehydrogenase family)